MLGIAFAVPYHEIYATATATAGKSCRFCPVCSCDPCPSPQQSPIWTFLSFILSTCEVLLRSFTLGFGIRMLVYIFSSDKPPQAQTGGGDGGGKNASGGGVNILNDNCVRRNIQMAILAGVSTASAVFGSSLFIPASIRTKWFNYIDE
jgi:hypothetical protein